MQEFIYSSRQALSQSHARNIPTARSFDGPVSRATFDFELPPELEATEPPEARGVARDEVRLLVSQGARPVMTHARFREIETFLAEGDTLVINTSGTLNAALPASIGALTLQLHLSVQFPDRRWIVELRAPEGY